jgi:hypothetical protein
MANVQHQSHTYPKQKIYHILQYQYVYVKLTVIQYVYHFFDVVLFTNYLMPVYITGKILNNVGN